MGRRKSSAKAPVKRKKAGIPSKVFECPLCGDETGIIVTVKRQNKTGTLQCKTCPAQHTYKNLNPHIEGAVDVFTHWLDHLEREQREQQREAAEHDAEREAGGDGALGMDDGGDDYVGEDMSDLDHIEMGDGAGDGVMSSDDDLPDVGEAAPVHRGRMMLSDDEDD